MNSKNTVLCFSILCFSAAMHRDERDEFSDEAVTCLVDPDGNRLQLGELLWNLMDKFRYLCKMDPKDDKRHKIANMKRHLSQNNFAHLISFFKRKQDEKRVLSISDISSVFKAGGLRFVIEFLLADQQDINMIFEHHSLIGGRYIELQTLLKDIIPEDHLIRFRQFLDSWDRINSPYPVDFADWQADFDRCIAFYFEYQQKQQPFLVSRVNAIERIKDHLHTFEQQKLTYIAMILFTGLLIIPQKNIERLTELGLGASVKEIFDRAAQYPEFIQCVADIIRERAQTSCPDTFDARKRLVDTLMGQPGFVRGFMQDTAAEAPVKVIRRWNRG